MNSKICRIAVFAIVVAVVMTTFFSETDATYRKPPFNGSIFGKRAPNTAEYDVASKALSSICEIASEACQTWFVIDSK